MGCLSNITPNDHQPLGVILRQKGLETPANLTIPAYDKYLFLLFHEYIPSLFSHGSGAANPFISFVVSRTISYHTLYPRQREYAVVHKNHQRSSPVPERNPACTRY
jgi:hypothetical protein